MGALSLSFLLDFAFLKRKHFPRVGFEDYVMKFESTAVDLNFFS